MCACAAARSTSSSRAPKPESAVETAVTTSGPIALATGATAGPVDDADDATARTTLRLPDSLKTRAEAAAAAEGLSLNTWLVRGRDGGARSRARRSRRTRARRYTGWVR